MNGEKEEKCDCLTKQLESERKTTEEASIEVFVTYTVLKGFGYVIEIHTN